MEKTAKGNFQGLIDTYRIAFTGREWLRLRLDSLMEERRCRIIVITGAAGVGKTAFLAHLADKNQEWLRYFIRQDSGQLLQPADATTFLLTVGSQLAATRPELFLIPEPKIKIRQRVDELEAEGEVVGVRIGTFLTSPFAKIALDVDQTVHRAAGQVTGVEIQQWVADARKFSLQDLQDIALVRPAETLSSMDPSARLVVIIDALDESRFSPAHTGILRALREMPEIPSNLTFIVSSRPDPSLEALLSRSDARELVLDANTDENKTDLRRFISETVDNETFSIALANHNLPQEEFVNALLAKSGGNFLYVRSILGAALDAASDAAKLERLPGLLDAKTLPENLAGLYGYFLKSITTWCRQEFPTQTWSKYLGPMLGVLAVAREPLNASQVASFIGHKISDVNLLLQETRQFIEIIDDTYGKPARYRIFHRSFAEYLLDSIVNRGFAVGAEGAHLQIADHFLNAWGGLNNQLSGASVADEFLYGLRHLSAHLCEAGRADLAAAVLRALSFIDAKARAGMVFALLEDYAEVLSRVSNKEEQRVLIELDIAISRAAEWLPRYSQSLAQYLFAELYATETASGVAESFAADILLPAVNSNGQPWLEPLRRRRANTNLQIPDGPIHRFRRDIAFLSDGFIAIACNDGVIQLWKERQPLREIIIPLSPDVEVLTECDPGVIVVVGRFLQTSARLLLTVDVKSSRIGNICELNGEPQEYIEAIRSLPDNRIAVFTGSGSYQVMDQLTGELIFSNIFRGDFTAAAITPDGKVIYATKPEGDWEDLLGPRSAWLWDPRNGDIRVLAEYSLSPSVLLKIMDDPEIFERFVERFDAICIRPDGTILLSFSSQCYFGDPKNHQIQYALEHSSAIRKMAAGPGDLIALCGEDVALKRQSLPVSQNEEGFQPTKLRALAPLPDGRVMVFSGMNSMSCFDPVTANLSKLGSLIFDRFLIDSAVVLDNGTMAFASVLDGWAIAVDATKNAQVIGRLKTHRVSSRHGNVASFLCREEDGYTIKNWNSETGRIEVISLGEVCRDEDLWVFCQLDDHRFAFGSLKGSVWLWDMRSEEVMLLGSVGFKTTGLGIGPGGHLFACFDDGTLMIWNVDANGDPVSILLDGRPVALGCAPTSSYVSVGLADGKILAFKLCGAS